MNTFILPGNLAHGVKNKLLLIGKLKCSSISSLPCSPLEVLLYSCTVWPGASSLPCGQRCSDCNFEKCDDMKFHEHFAIENGALNMVELILILCL